MSDTVAHEVVKSLLIRHFNTSETTFSFTVPLEELDADFKVLNYLIYFEQLLNEAFTTKILLLESINAAVHTAGDISDLVETTLISNPK